MPRQLITEQRLISRLNEALANGEKCRHHTVSAVMRVDKKENAGCNWAISVMSCVGSFSSAGNREAETVIKTYQGLYKLREGAWVSPVSDPENLEASA